MQNNNNFSNLWRKNWVLIRQEKGKMNAFFYVFAVIFFVFFRDARRFFQIMHAWDWPKNITDVNSFWSIPSMQLFQKNDVDHNLWYPEVRQRKLTANTKRNAFIFRFFCRIRTKFFRQRLGKLLLFCILIFSLSF